MQPINMLRKNKFDHEWIMYAPGRAKVQSITDGSIITKSTTPSCPFCPGAPEVGYDYDVCILPNRFPSFIPGSNILLEEDELQKNGYGKQNVFIFSSEHDKNLVDQPISRIAKLLTEIGKQVAIHYQDKRIQAVVAFENSGSEFGPSIKHPHGQMFALPFVPKRLLPTQKQCIICEHIAKNDYQNNIIEETNNAFLVCPPYARFPFEMHIFPKNHFASLNNLNYNTLTDIAKLTKLGLQLLAAIKTGKMSYMLLIYVAPKTHLHDYHLRIEIVPINKPFGGRKYLGGLELGFGVFVNPAIPEEIAAQLRKLKKVLTPS